MPPAPFPLKKNGYDGSAIQNTDQQALRSTLLYAADAAWQAQLQLSVEDKNTDGTGGRSANLDYLPGDPFDDYFSDLDHGFEERDILFGNFRAEYNANAWQFETITAYRVLHYDDLVDTAGTGLRTVRLYAGADEENRQFSQDFLWHRTDDFSRFTFGASYYRQRADQLTHLVSTTDTVNVAVSRQVSFPVMLMAPGNDYEESSRNGGTFKTLSAFGDIAITLNEYWELFGGMRYSHDDKRHFVDGMGSNYGFPSYFLTHPIPRHMQHGMTGRRARGLTFTLRRKPCCTARPTMEAE